MSIDHVGDSYVELNVKDFFKWLNEHKQELATMNMKTLNHKIHWVDDGKNRYKLHCLRGKYVLKRCSTDYYNDKHDFMNKLYDLERQLKELAHTLENFIKSDTPEEEPGNLGTAGGGFDMRFPKV